MYCLGYMPSTTLRVVNEDETERFMGKRGKKKKL